jgi:hypothetical protein
MFHPEEAAAHSANPSGIVVRPAGAPASPNKAVTHHLVGSISSDMSELQRRLDSLSSATGRGHAHAPSSFAPSASTASSRLSSSLLNATSRE